MTHWLLTAIRTYLLHPEHGNGYLWWSAEGSDLAYVSVFLVAAKHLNCAQHGCWRPGHRHPDHGLRVCRHHYHHDVVPPKENPE